MESRYGLYNQGRNGLTSLSEEFQEEDVWDVLKERNDFPSNSISSSNSNSNSSTITPRQLSTARMVPRSSKNTTQECKIIQQSAPVNIPYWPSVYGKKKSSWLDDDGDGDGDGDDGEEGDDDGYGNVMPPHEWIARKLARSQISSFSVCEGAGRTLKGRDLSRVRNDVLTKTGFLE